MADLPLNIADGDNVCLMTQRADLYRELPSVDELLRHSELAPLISREGQVAVADACRVVLSRLRNEITSGYLDESKLQLAISGLCGAIREEVDLALGYSLRAVINATGVILHTNLGRAPISHSALDHIAQTAAEYSNLEFDLESGERGKRDVHVERLFRKLLQPQAGSSGAERQTASVSTIVVNNNAAAVLLALNTLAEGGEVIVSRGELVEIGGSFRIPDVMGKSGAILKEVGATNRTRISDYEHAITDKTRVILRVHRSNFEISGFTEQPSIEELVALARRRRLPLVEDLGSGALFDLQQVGIGNEPGVSDSLRLGVDAVTYSGDKLFGGPQAGLISGRDDLVKRMRGNSLFRALRVDKLTYAALEATLLAYVKRKYDDLPAVRMMQITSADIACRAESLAAGAGSKGLQIELIAGESLIGGGSAPSAVLPTTLLAITCHDLTANELATRLRAANPPVIARVEEGRVLLDLRTVFPHQDQALSQILAEIAPR
jgi:L-seryl-tRNA(Ser) seleniumtransferase